ncbi:hypothetical protein E4U53_004701, partial [Claviceps sorghi]
MLAPNVPGQHRPPDEHVLDMQPYFEASVEMPPSFCSASADMQPYCAGPRQGRQAQAWSQHASSVPRRKREGE